MGTIQDGRLAGQLFDRWGPVIHVGDADAAGVGRGVLRRLVERGELTRIAKRALTDTKMLAAQSAWGQFRLRSIGFGLSIGDDAYLTGSAAAIIHGLPLASDPPRFPTAVRPGNPHTGHDRTPYGRVRHGFLPDYHRTFRSRVRVVDQAYCAVDVSRHLGPTDGLLVADAVLQGGGHRESMVRLTENMRPYPGIRTARWVVEHADGRTESPLETMGRLVFIAAGMTPPLSNPWVQGGDRWFRADHLLPDSGIILEADGAIKYNNRPDAAELINADRNRERLLRKAGFGIVRYTWNIANGHPAELLRRVREMEGLRFGQPVPTCWSMQGPWDDHARRVG